MSGRVLFLVFMSAFVACGGQSPMGLFTSHADVGRVAMAGSAVYDPKNGLYSIAGSGDNMWFTNDAFHFLWREASGDLSFAASVRWRGIGGHPHRKACLIIRQALTPDSAYADAVVHGDGLASLQCRESRGGPTCEIQVRMRAPERLRLERRGDYVSISVGRAGEEAQPAGGSFRIRLTDPFYVGLGVCSHDSNRIERAEFSRVDLSPLPRIEPAKMKTRSTLETISIDSGDRKVIYHTTNHIEAPNWSRDGSFFLFNSAGRLYKMPVTGGVPSLVETAFANRCNNDHGISPDGKLIAISDQSADGKSRIYLAPIDGGIPGQITKLGPSYWHGWSPDGRTLAYCAERAGSFDVYTIPVEGGQEERLTNANGLDDGPDYSPDGKWIYFNSDRTGQMHIWRMAPDGTDQRQITSDEYNNWFPHPSPDGKWLVFLSYDKSVTGHPPNKDVSLRLMNIGSGEIRTLAHLFGGQGTLNVPSWSPDSRSFAFVSYQLSPQD